jgi:hypothetical protein
MKVIIVGGGEEIEMQVMCVLKGYGYVEAYRAFGIVGVCGRSLDGSRRTH